MTQSAIVYPPEGKGATVFTGGGVEVFRAKALASGLRLYARTRLKPNRMWSPSAMVQTAAQITGKKLKAKGYAGAADALDEWADEQVKSGKVEVK